MAKIAIATLKSVSPYSQSKVHETLKLPKESADAYDARTWREHLHCDAEDNVIIHANVWKNSLDDAASFLSIKIKGRGNNTYAKHFGGGVLCFQPSLLGIKKQDVKCERLYLNSDGKRGGGKRVWRTYPIIHEWKCEAEYNISDDTITEEVFEEHLEAVGKFIGIGRFRPRNRGHYGRFAVLKVKWK